MPFPFLPAAMAASGLVSAIGQNQAQQTANRHNIDLSSQQKEWQERMYAMQKNDSINFWRMENQYNSPEAQMQRLKDAGLNPHLVYGRPSSGGNISAPKVGNYQRANVDAVTKGYEKFGEFSNYATQVAQVGKLKSSAELDHQNSILAATKALTEAANADIKGVEAQIAKELKETSIDAAKMNLENLTHQTAVNSARAKYSDRYEGLKVDKIEQELNNLKKSAEIMDAEKAIKQFHARLAEQNMSPNDNIALRTLAKYGLLDKFIKGQISSKDILNFITNIKF